MAGNDSTLTANKKVVRDFLETFSTGKVPAILAWLTDDLTWWVSGTIPGISGTYTKAQLAPLLEGATDFYTHGAMKWTPSGAMTAEEDRVAVEATSYAELKSGKVYANTYHLLFTVRGGKIAKVREYMDTQHGLETFVS